MQYWLCNTLSEYLLLTTFMLSRDISNFNDDANQLHKTFYPVIDMDGYISVILLVFKIVWKFNCAILLLRTFQLRRVIVFLLNYEYVPYVNIK